MGPRADVVFVQTHIELLQLRELCQGVGQAPCAVIAWEALELCGAVGESAERVDGKEPLKSNSFGVQDGFAAF